MCNHYFLIASVLALLISCGLVMAAWIVDKKAEFYEVSEEEYREIVQTLRKMEE